MGLRHSDAAALLTGNARPRRPWDSQRTAGPQCLTAEAHFSFIFRNALLATPSSAALKRPEAPLILDLHINLLSSSEKHGRRADLRLCLKL